MERKPEAPAGQIAERLEDATAGSLVYVDERGQVRSPARYRGAMALRFGGIAAFMVGANWLYWLIGGPIGLAVGGTMTLLLLRQVRAWARLRRAVALIVVERLDEAEALLRPIHRALGIPRALVARAHQNLARIAALRGRHDEALALQGAALSLTPTDRASRVQRRMVEYARVVTLVNLDRLAEARSTFDALPRMLEGDYLRTQRAAAELYLAFAEGHHRFEPDYLREQAEIFAALPSARLVLALVAWAEEQLDRRDEARSLLAIARAAPGGSLLRRLYPRLGVWMDAGLHNA